MKRVKMFLYPIFILSFKTIILINKGNTFVNIVDTVILT